uniref:Uncharacterized protein n=1 Tax=Astyanax mexicanus TaxID=7994 RepID=A0A8B9JIF7_ASTMX
TQIKTLCCSHFSPGGTALDRLPFHVDLWIYFTIQNWILDFGRPIVMKLKYTYISIISAFKKVTPIKRSTNIN